VNKTAGGEDGERTAPSRAGRPRGVLQASAYALHSKHASQRRAGLTKSARARGERGGNQRMRGPGMLRGRLSVHAPVYAASEWRAAQALP